MNSFLPALKVSGLTVKFGTHYAVSDLNFELYSGETLAIVGESGSGKSVTAAAIMRLLEFESRAPVVKGSVRYLENDAEAKSIDLYRLSKRKMRSLRGQGMAMIFQEPATALNPTLTVGNQIAECLLLHKSITSRKAFSAAIELLQRVWIQDPERRARQYPHELSGGMRQRVMIAMAVACAPRILIADEPTTALDVTVQAQILDIIKSLQAEMNTAVLFITHDMGVVAEIADRVVVMQESKMVESGSVYDIFERPKREYTQQLLSSVPRLGSMAGKTDPEPFADFQSLVSL